MTLLLTACWSLVVNLNTYSCTWCTTPGKCLAGFCPSGYGLASDSTCQGKTNFYWLAAVSDD